MIDNEQPDDMDGINPVEAAFWANLAADAAGTAAYSRDAGAPALAGDWAAIATLRATVAMAVAQAGIFAALRDIANALRDDAGNNPAHILHNMSYQLAVIARNTGAIDDEATQEAER